MTTSATVPVTVTPEAAARIAELGFQAEVDRMIDYARQNLPDVARIEVVLNERYDGDDDGVAIDVFSYCDHDGVQIFNQVSNWLISEFPGEVLVNLHISYYSGPEYAR